MTNKRPRTPSVPQRPDHPDFWLISQAIIDITRAVDESRWPLQDMIGQVVDLTSLKYMAEQRASRAVDAGIADRDHLMVIATAWMEAFYTGTRYDHMKAHGAQEFPAQCEHDNADNIEPAGALLCRTCQCIIHNGVVYRPAGPVPTGREGDGTR